MTVAMVHEVGMLEFGAGGRRLPWWLEGMCEHARLAVELWYLVELPLVHP